MLKFEILHDFQEQINIKTFKLVIFLVQIVSLPPFFILVFATEKLWPRLKKVFTSPVVELRDFAATGENRACEMSKKNSWEVWGKFSDLALIMFKLEQYLTMLYGLEKCKLIQ